MMLAMISRTSMEYLNRWKEAPAAMARTRPDGRCKKHPTHKQSPGVCSICLTEKLSQLSATFPSSRSASSSLDSLSSSSSSFSSYYSYYSSSSCSSCSSPTTRHFRYGNDGKGPFSFLFSIKNALTKSITSVLVSRTNEDKVYREKMKTGLWSKFPLGPRNNKRIKDDLVLSTTMTGRMMLTT